MQQKVIQIGNSIGAVIPQLLNRDTAIKPGDAIDVQRKGDKFILSPLKKNKRKLAGGVNAKFMKMVDEFVDEHEDVLKKLADR